MILAPLLLALAAFLPYGAAAFAVSEATHCFLGSSWSPVGVAHRRTTATRFSSRCFPTTTSLAALEFDQLMDMDVVIYSKKGSTGHDEEKKFIGAIQEDGSLAPLSAWSTEPVYDEALEFLVDEDDRLPGLRGEQVVVHSRIPEGSLSYGSRQVGGGKGPGNPHGEESELLYYIDQGLLEGIEIKVNPDLEILW